MIQCLATFENQSLRTGVLTRIMFPQWCDSPLNTFGNIDNAEIFSWIQDFM